jgi:hypothetical protein
MTITNLTKITSAVVNSTKIVNYETWDSNTTTWDTETRTWDDMASIWDNTSKPTTTFTNISKP